MALLTPTAYATLADLTTYGLSVAARGALAVIDQQKHLDAANAKIDSYLGAKFTLPIVAWGADLAQAAAEIAAFGIITERGFDPEDPGDQVFQKRMENQVAWLKLVSRGEVTPVVQDSASGGKGGSGGNPFTAQARTNISTTQAVLDGQVSINTDPQAGMVVVGRPILRGWW